MKIHPIQKKYFVDHAVAELITLISEAGSHARLPSETELAKQMNVSRPIIREALQGLKLTGLITSNKKDGTKISEPSVKKTLAHLLLFHKAQSKRWHQIGELRYALELGMLDIVLERMTAEEITIMEQYAEELNSATSLKKIIELEIKFHQCYYSGSHSTILQELSELLMEFFNDCLSSKLIGKKMRALLQSRQEKGEHLLFARALKSRNREAAHTLLKRHLLHYLDKY